ncbi:MAG: ribonuclease P protein component [Candidatus Omnitrophica bacterium]|nr:ribonuclease P protein component [Candidatus Omnitrophota bacterium]
MTRKPYKGIRFTLYLSESQADLPAQHRIAIAKKLLRKATERNRWKRRIREVLRSKKSQIRPGFQITIKLREVNEETPTFKEIKEEIVGLLDKAELL